MFSGITIRTIFPLVKVYIVTMSKSLSMKNIFEGVETSAELAEIKNMNGELIQGYLFSKPLISASVDEWLNMDNDFTSRLNF